MHRVAALLRGRRASPVAVPLPVVLPAPRPSQRRILAPPLTPPSAEEATPNQDPDQTPILENEDEDAQDHHQEDEDFGEEEEEDPDWLDALARHGWDRGLDDVDGFGFHLGEREELAEEEEGDHDDDHASSSSSSSSSGNSSSDEDLDAPDAPFLMAGLPVLMDNQQQQQQQQLRPSAEDQHVQFQLEDHDIGLDFGVGPEDLLEAPNARQVPEEIDLTGDSDDEASAVPRPLASEPDNRVIVIADDGHDDIVIAPGVPVVSGRRKRRRNDSDAVSTETSADKRARMFDTDRAESTSVTMENSETIERFKHALKCSVCLDNIHEMTSTICGHVYCRECITLAVRVNHKCPLCQRSLRMNNIHPLYF